MKDARKLPQFNIRLPLELKDYLQRKADEGYRSLNNEVVKRLEESRQREEQADVCQ